MGLERSRRRATALWRYENGYAVIDPANMTSSWNMAWSKAPGSIRSPRSRSTFDDEADDRSVGRNSIAPSRAKMAEYATLFRPTRAAGFFRSI